MAEIKLEKRKVADLIEYEMNPRRNDKAVDAVRESIIKFGYANPIIINGENVILAGHTRLRALKELGKEEADCVVVPYLTEQEERAFRIADNRSSEFSSWDGDLLDAEMREISADDWEAFGFREKELKKKDHRICTCPRCGKSFQKI